jgi:hypothetical protein
MIKITIENTVTGEKMMVECDAFAIATVENMGSVNERIYTTMGNVGNGDLDIEELADAIVERVVDDNISAYAEAMGVGVEDIIDICNYLDGDCEDCCCGCGCCY